MNLSEPLAQTLLRAHSLPEILDAAVGLVKGRMRCRACSVFLLDRGDVEPRLRARSGMAADAAVGPAATSALAAVVVSTMAPGTRQSADRTLMGVPMLLRDRAVGAIVVESGDGQVFSADESSSLGSLAAQLVGIVVNARLIGGLERGEDKTPMLLGPSDPHHARVRGEVVVHGAIACPGVGIGAAAFRGVHALSADVRGTASQGAAQEHARLRDALVKSRNDIAKLQSAAALDIDEEHALIFSSHLLLLNDPLLLERMDRAIDAGGSAPVAVDDALEELEALLRAVPDGYLQERVDDIDDLRGRLLSHLIDSGERAKREGRVVVTKRIPPSLVVELKAERAQGIVTQDGAATSHGTLLARALGIPTVSGVADLLDQVQAGDVTIVDGDAGKVILRPEPATLELYRERARTAERLRTEYAKFRDAPLATADGVRVGVLANIAVASDLSTARDNGAEGVGLYRTEFPFLVREQFPTRDEQVRIYRKAYEAFPDGPIHFRILDLGGDKFVPGSSLGTQRGAFHGYRGIRVLFDHPHLLRDQVQAFALAAAGRPLSILVPMVTSMEELRRTKAIVAEALDALPPGAARPIPAIGAMIEAPAAVEIAPEIAREVDYLSIGTNDLVQYALVVDREDPRMSTRRDAYHPAILRMVRRTIAAARAVAKPVIVCGEMAARPDLAAALVALGVDVLSVVPAVIPELKQAFAGLVVGQLGAAMDAILACTDAQTLEATLRDRIAAASRPPSAAMPPRA